MSLDIEGPPSHNQNRRSRDYYSKCDGAADDSDPQMSEDESLELSDHRKRTIKMTERAKCVHYLWQCNGRLTTPKGIWIPVEVWESLTCTSCRDRYMAIVILWMLSII
jgi:hypothetical protein